MLLRDVPPESVEHVGSTSVQGMLGRPIIDIAIIVKQENVQLTIDALIHTGQFEYLGDLGFEGRHAIRYRNDLHPSRQERDVYVCVDGAFHTRNLLALRDTLRSSPQLCQEYASIKHNLATRGVNLEDYNKAKAGIIQKILTISGKFTKEELASLAIANLKWGLIAPTLTNFTNGLILREFQLHGDANTLRKLVSDPDNPHGASPAYGEAYNKLEAIQRGSLEIPRRRIELAVDYQNEFIGAVRAVERSRPSSDQNNTYKPRQVELSYAIVPGWEDKGFGFEVVEKFIEVLEEFWEKPLECIIKCDGRDAWGIGVARLLRFHRTGVPRKDGRLAFRRND